NPLGGTTCLMPWPSAAYQVADSSTESGYRLDIPLEAMPVNVDEIAVDPAPWNRHDGFSPSGAMLAAFPGGVSPDGLPGHQDPAASLADDSLTVVVEIDSGERLLHFAEVDMNIEDPALRTLIIRPLERMAPGARYAVGIRRGLLSGEGQPLEPSEGFAALRDGRSFDHPRFAPLAENADAMFAALAAAGAPKEDLILAWHFVTASDESLTRDLLAMRDQALPAMGEAGESLSFEASEIEGNPDLTHRMLLGTHDAPNFMTDGESDDSIIRRDGAGIPEMSGMYPANFAAAIPACVTSEPLPIPVVVFGHGLFGSAEGYIGDTFLQEIANDNCVVVVAGDWIGLTERQITSAALSANDLNRSHALVEKLGQAVINFIALEHLVRGPLAEAPELELDGQPIIDTSRVYYLGASLGGIMGGTFMAYDPVIERGALGVPGAAWSLLIERSFAWAPLQVAAIGAYEDQYEYQLLISFLAFSMERWDPITTATRVLADPLPGTPPKQILMYEALNDSLVTNLSTEMAARTMGIPIAGPTVKMPYGFAMVTDPVPSALAIYDEHPDPAVPVTNVPPATDNGTHAGVNERPALLRQVVHFMLEGEIVNQCRDGEAAAACDCAAGACE
ncbi:MAG TPA: hypothetical protein VFU21_29190, partial [Kofleriaceae bacterium]|nr:hypothetical protein [Kofleriaceae bacterium]